MSRLIPEMIIAEQNEQLRGSSEQATYDWLIGSLYQAFAEARRGKQATVNEQQFEEDRDVNLVRLADDIIHRRYEPSRSVAFIITNPTPREIFAASFRDRVVHHLLVQIVGNFWDKRLSPRSFSCRDGKGTLYGIRCLESDIRSATNNWQGTAWVMKIDIQGYFMSLSRDYLFQRVCFGLDKQFSMGGPIYDICKFLWGKIIFDDPLDGVRLKGSLKDWDILPPSKSMFNSATGRGIVIGNLTSQWVSNMALDPLDRYVMMELGCKRYGRYVDDAYFVADTKERLLEIRSKVDDFLTDLGLVMHPKKFYLQPTSKGVAFLGVVIHSGRIVIGKRFRRNMRLLKRAVDENGLSQKSIDSVRVYQGLSSHYSYRKSLYEIFGKELLRDVAKWYHPN